MIRIRKFRKSDLIDSAKLVREVFSKFNRKEGPKKAIDEYLSYYKTTKDNIEGLQKIFFTSPIVFVAVEGTKIIGLVRGNKKKVGNLFVKGKYHGKGIGRRLMKKFEREALKLGSREIRIKASLYAVPFYQKMGYKKTTGHTNLYRIETYNRYE